MIKVAKIFNNNYVFSVLTKIYLLAIGVVFSALQVRFLGTELNGELTYIKSASAILNTIFVFGIHQAYAHFRRKYGNEFKNYYLGSVIILFLVYLFLCVFIEIAVRPEFENAVIILLIPILFFIRIIRYVTLIEQPKTKNEVELLVGTIKLLFVFILFTCISASSIWVMVLLLFEEVLCLIFYLKKMRIHPIFNADSLKLLCKLMAFGIIPMINLLFNSLNYKVDILMLKAQTTYIDVSIYSVAVTLAEECWAIPDAIRDILMSKLSNGKTSEEVAKIIRFSNVFTIVTQVVLLLVGRLIIYILYGKEYGASYSILVLALWGSYGMIYTKMISAYNVVVGDQVYNLIFMIITALINIIFNALFIPNCGIYGAAIASVISYNLSGLLLIVHFIRKTGTKMCDLILINRNDILEAKRLFIGKK